MGGKNLILICKHYLQTGLENRAFYVSLVALIRQLCWNTQQILHKLCYYIGVLPSKTQLNISTQW